MHESRWEYTAQDYWAKLTKGDGRAMMLTMVVKPDRHAQFWFTVRGEPLDKKIVGGLWEKLGPIAPPSVKDGPVAFGLLVNLWGGGDQPVRSGGPATYLLFPADWQEAASAANKSLQIPLGDDVLAIVWPD